MVGETNTSRLRVVGGTISSAEMSNLSTAQTTWRYKDVTYNGFTTTPLVLTSLNYTINNDYGSVGTCAANITTTGARIIISYNISSNIEKVNWLAVGY